jgi:acetyltransferase-like isoleucine patch superfamily enzyme
MRYPDNLAYRLSCLRAFLFSQAIHKHQFGGLGWGSWIKRPDQIMGAKRIFIGNKTRIENGFVLYSVGYYAKNFYGGQIVIGNNCYLNRYGNISSASSVTIEDGVVFGSNVFVCDFDHNFRQVQTNINRADLMVRGKVLIKKDAWVGNNVVIQGDVTIGERAVIGASSVVTKSVPDWSVAFGNPARVRKRFDLEKQLWIEHG